MKERFSRNKFTIFLDRDNTLIKDYPYNFDSNKIHLIEPAINVLAKLDKYCNYFIITNQSGIGRGYFTVKELNIFHNRLLEILEHININIIEIKFCPHKPEDDCECRKPKIKMVQNLINSYKINKEFCAFIGDKDIDLQTAKNAKIKLKYKCDNSINLSSIWEKIYNEIFPIVENINV